MTTKPNSATLTVSRELLESFAAYVADSPNAIMRARAGELRALLAQPADQQGEPDFYEVSGNGVRPGLFYTSPDWAMEDPRYTVTPHWRKSAQPATAKVDENAEFEKWRNEQCASLERTGHIDAAKKFSELGSIHWAAWQARAKLNGGQP